MNQSTSPQLSCLPHASRSLTPVTKISVVAVGYGIAVAVAVAAVACHWFAIGGVARQTYSGMNVFGDGLLFLAVFSIASIPATCLAFFFLRSQPAFWRVFAVVAGGVAMTGLVAVAAVVIDVRSMAAGVAFPRILVAPMFALIFGSGGLLSPRRSWRMVLFAAAAVEATTFAAWVISCIVRNA